MNATLRSLKEQARNGTLERNTIIALRGLAGEDFVILAGEFNISKARVCTIIKRYKQNKEEAQSRIEKTETKLIMTEKNTGANR
jgi:hypothetical protein